MRLLVQTARALAAICVLALAMAFGGCSSSRRVVVVEPGSAPSTVAGPVARLKIPRGHYPPPGHCRVWIPGRPPGRQPSASPCYALQGRVPAGAWVLYRPPEEDELIEVTAYDPQHARDVLWIRYFEMSTGDFVQEVPSN